MTRSELIARIAQKNPNLTVKDVENVVRVIFSEIINALAAKNRIEFRGFGAFSVRKRAPRTAKNPKTGTRVEVSSRNIIHFKTGKELHNMLNKEDK